MSSLDDFNQWSLDRAQQELLRCCASENWALKVAKMRPYESEKKLFEVAREIWFSLDKTDWLEAFAGHSKIGDLDSLKKKYAQTKGWSEQEQAGVEGADETVLHELIDYNERYEQKFGYIFIVCATGKQAAEMLALLKHRLDNDPDNEIRVAAEEQSQITKIRLEKML